MEVIVDDPYSYKAGICKIDINAVMGFEIIDSSTVRLTFHNLVPEETEQT